MKTGVCLMLLATASWAGAAGSFQNFRVPYHTAICEGCQRAEYACTCDH